jgi:HEAT repeat protein
MQPILAKLEGGDRRSIGRSNEVVADVLADPRLFDAVFSGMSSADPLVRMRSADALEKVTSRHPEYLRPYKAELIGKVAQVEQKEVRWHVAQMLPRVGWNARERRRVFHVLEGYLDDRSSIVRTFAMQALADLAGQAPELLPAVLAHLRELAATGTPAMKARGRKLLAALSRPAAKRP